jgi:hypothetical protein
MRSLYRQSGSASSTRSPGSMSAASVANAPPCVPGVSTTLRTGSTDTPKNGSSDEATVSSTPGSPRNGV